MGIKNKWWFSIDEYCVNGQTKEYWESSIEEIISANEDLKEIKRNLEKILYLKQKLQKLEDIIKELKDELEGKFSKRK